MLKYLSRCSCPTAGWKCGCQSDPPNMYLSSHTSISHIGGEVSCSRTQWLTCSTPCAIAYRHSRTIYCYCNRLVSWIVSLKHIIKTRLRDSFTNDYWMHFILSKRIEVTGPNMINFKCLYALKFVPYSNSHYNTDLASPETHGRVSSLVFKGDANYPKIMLSVLLFWRALLFHDATSQVK